MRAVWQENNKKPPTKEKFLLIPELILLTRI